MAVAVAETAEEEVRADTAVELCLVDQLDLGPVLLPLPEAVLRDRPETPWGVRRLNPAVLSASQFSPCSRTRSKR